MFGRHLLLNRWLSEVILIYFHMCIWRSAAGVPLTFGYSTAHAILAVALSAGVVAPLACCRLYMELVSDLFALWFTQEKGHAPPRQESPRLLRGRWAVRTVKEPLFRTAFFWSGDSRANLLTMGVSLFVMVCSQLLQCWHYQQLVLLAG